MSADFDTLELFSKTVVDTQPWLADPRMYPIPWRSVEKKSKLKIAVLWNDGVVTPTPPVTRALKETAEKLKAKGHEVIDWSSDLHPEIISLLVSLSLNIDHCLETHQYSRAACLLQTAAKPSASYSNLPASHGGQRWTDIRTLRSWEHTTCGKFTSSAQVSPKII